jgi:uncharacterized membrane protein
MNENTIAQIFIYLILGLFFGFSQRTGTRVVAVIFFWPIIAVTVAVKGLIEILRE